MNTEQLELRCHTPQTFVVMGLRLRPLTIGHVAMLRVFSADQVKDAGDLGIAAVICATREDKVLRTVNSWWMKPFLWLWKRLLGKWDFKTEVKKFSDYLTYNTELPMISRKGETSSAPASAIPFDRMLRTILTSSIGYRPIEVNGTPYLEALWSFVSWAEMQDRIRVMDRTESEVDEAISAIDWDDVIKRGNEMFANPEHQ